MSKITVMIVDDEKYVIEDLIGIFDWEANGFQIVATAYNGRQALNKFREFSPQVVISDIKMPFMDGIELIANIRRINKQTKILLLTAYRDFEYAKQAIQLGITDYILKWEINEQRIREQLFNVKELIGYDFKISLMLAQKVIRDLFNSRNDLLPEFSIPDPGVKKLLTTPVFYMIVDQDLPLPISDVPSHEKSRTNYMEIMSCCMFLQAEDFRILSAGAIGINQVVLLIQLTNCISQLMVNSLMFQKADSIKRHLQENLGCSFSIFYIDNKQTLFELKKSYSTLSRRLNAKYLLGNNKVYNFYDINLGIDSKAVTVDEAILERMIEKMDEAAIMEYIDSVYSRVLPPNMSFDSLVSVSQAFYRILVKTAASIPAAFNKTDLSEANNREYWLNGEGIKNWMKCKYREIAGEMIIQNKNRYSNVVLKAMQFISRNFNNKDLTISNIAEHVCLSSTRLSVSFKKETGMTVNKYIADIRIKKAKELLCEPSFKVYEISSMVGYGSSQYFSQIFKNVTGFNPGDFKKGLNYENKKKIANNS